MTIKEKADALAQKHKPHSDQYWDDKQEIHCAILSVEHTIDVLERFKDQRFTDTIMDAIKEQTELLTELKSRI